MKAPNGWAKGGAQWRETAAKTTWKRKPKCKRHRHDPLRGFHKPTKRAPCLITTVY